MPAAPLPPSNSSERWRFLRDVLVFQLKMLIDNGRDFALIPMSLGAAVIDLIFKGKREGALFYQVLRWGAHSEKIIAVYSSIEGSEHDATTPSYTVDAAIARLEAVVVREYEKGGTAANIKDAMDRAIDQLHRETGPTRRFAEEAVARTAGLLRTTLELEPAASLTTLADAITTREFLLADYEGAAALWREAEGVELCEGDSREEIAQYLQRNPGLSRVAEVSGALAGAALCGHDGRRGFIYHLAVAPAFRGRGVGRMLMDDCLRGLRAKGLPRAIILVADDNSLGQEFWLRRGWEKIEALAMARDLA